MKSLKLLIIALIISAPMVNAFAGDDDSNKKKGIRAGWQMSNFYNEGKSTDGNLSSFYVGVFGEKKLIPMLRLGTGIEFSTVGQISESIDDTKYVRSMIYVPVYLKLKLGPVFALGGASANFGISNKFKLAGEDMELSDDNKTNVFDVPVFLGLGVKIMMISIEARYNWGTMNLSKIDNNSYTNQYFQLGAAFSF
jgi:hypothetical protein